MNLQPAKLHESVTILMVPLDQYSAFPGAVDAVLKETRLPFELIIIEGNAPESVRLKLERRKKHHKNIKIIYSAHRPRMAEALNLGFPHIRTRLAFFTHNNVRVTPLWLEHLLKQARDHPGIVCPYVAHHENTVREKDLPEVDMNGFLATREILRSLNGFDEKVSAPLLGMDLAQRSKQHGIAVHRDPFTVLEYEPALFSKSFDLKFFQHQWSEKHVRESVFHMRKKWGLRLHESKYMEWLQKRKRFLQKRPTNAAFDWEELPLRLEFPKISLRKFLQVLTRA
jgi:GT2 family glycosyltransferase